MKEYPQNLGPLPVLKLRNKTDGGEGPLYKGNRGELVEQCQKMLFELGYDLGDPGIDGIFGNITEKIVIKFQEKWTDWEGRRLKTDGLVGPRTSDALNRAMVGEWYPIYITQTEITKDKQMLYVTVTKDELRKNVSLYPKDAKGAKLVIVDLHSVPIEKRSEPSIEKSWSIEHPEGFVDFIGADHIILWNFDVGGAELKPDHEMELDSLIKSWKVLALDPRSKIFIDGHASRSGSEYENETLSIVRASAVNQYLINKGINYERIGKEDYHGSSMPWFPNLTGASMARNRRVEVRIIRPEMFESKKRDTLEPPKIQEERQEDLPKVELIQTPKLGDNIPNISFEVKIPLEGPAKPLGKDIILYPSGEFKVKLKLKTPTPTTVALCLDLKTRRLSIIYKQKLNEYLEIKEEGGKGTGKFSISLYNTPLKPEFEVNLIEFHKPLSINVSQSIKLPDIDLGDGLEFEVEGELKAKFGFGPSPGTIMRFGARGGVVGGTVFAILAFNYFVIKEIEGASEKGKERGRKVARRDAYAWRIAGEATRGTAGYIVAEDQLSVYKIKHSDGSEYAIPGSEYAIEGWSIADKAIKNLSLEKQNVIFKQLMDHNKSDVWRIQNEIFRKVGGLSKEDSTLPTDLESLLR